MILAFKISINDEILDECIQEIKERYRQPNNPSEIAKHPYMGTIIKKRKNIIIIKTEIIYKYLNPILYLPSLLIDNKYIFYIAIKQLLRKKGYKGTTTLLNKTKTIEALLS